MLIFYQGGKTPHLGRSFDEESDEEIVLRQVSTDGKVAVPSPLSSYSSTAIRAVVKEAAEGDVLKSLEGLVPLSVAEFVARSGLYRD